MNPTDEILSEIRAFLDKVIVPNVVVVGALRYGAHLPALATMNKPHGSEIPLLLSHLIDFFPSSFFEGKKFLVLDDTVYQGKQMQDLTRKLVSKGVSTDSIQSAALVVHEQSAYRPDIYSRELRDIDYVIWKESLARLVRQQSRPIDRDNPLYYFKISPVKPLELVNLLAQFGVVQAPGEEWSESTLAFTLNIDSSVFPELNNLDGLSIAPLAKLRLYLQDTSNGHILTVAPIVLSQIELGHLSVSFLESLSSVLADNCIYLARGSSGETQYYYASRAISSLLLVRLIDQVAKLFAARHITATVLSPAVLDAPVTYLLPAEYHRFYTSVLEKLTESLGQSATTALPLTAEWKLPSVLPIARKRLDAYLPEKYDVLEYMTRNADPVYYDGARWCPNIESGPEPVTLDELIREFGSPLFISGAIDELLDSGLLKAFDYKVSDHIFTRGFANGGEYNAVRVSRLVAALRAKPANIPDGIAEREASELWLYN